MGDAYFGDGGARSTLKTLADQPDRVLVSESGLKVSDISSAQRQISSSLSAIDLRGLRILELSFGVVFVVSVTGLIYS